MQRKGKERSCSASAKKSSGDIRIGLIGDCRLGYSAGRDGGGDGQDCFCLFESAIKEAKELKVDVMVVCGALFDGCSPSMDTLNRTIKILNDNVFFEPSEGLNFIPGKLPKEELAKLNFISGNIDNNI
jgi:hypothetical protein